MRAKAHPDYYIENQQLSKTLEAIRHWKEHLADQIKLTEKEIKEILAFLADAKKPEDLTQAQLFEMERLENVLHEGQLLTLAEKNPYFARLDVSTLEYDFFHILNFQLKKNQQLKGGEKRSREKETVYLGKFGVESQDSGEQLIVDWRAPIADLFYSGVQGMTSFLGPYGPVKVELHLLRRLLIENSQLIEISDAEEASGIDDFLLSRLRESSLIGLKEIIATIQKDQNEIIRSPITKPLLVQGVAGSGKTSVALHRLSYLLYKNKGEFYPEDTLIVTPSRLFFNYIADLMPDLDIRRTNQLTFMELAQKVLPFKVSGVHDFFNFEQTISDENKKSIIASQLKGGMDAIRAIDEYKSFLNGVLIPPKDLVTDKGVILIEAKDLQKYFDDLKHLPLSQKAKKIHVWLKRQGKIILNRELHRINESYEGPLELARRRHPQHLQHLPNPEAINLLHQRDLSLKTSQKEIEEAITEFLSQIPKRLNVKTLYSEFLSEENLKIFWPQLRDEEREIIANNHLEKKKKIQPEDLALLMRLHQFCIGFEQEYSYIVVDEVQDLNISEIFMLKEMCTNGNAITLVGDLAQGIYPHRGIKTWHQVTENCFAESEINYREMNQSYRNDGEITQLTNKILLRNGFKPSKNIRPKENKPILKAFTHRVNTWAEKAVEAQKMVELFQKDENINTIGIIAKDLQNCRLFFQEFHKISKASFSFIEAEESKIEKKIVLIPAYLTKGLEFDACIVLDGEKSTYSQEFYDYNLLYVALTRPLHNLALFYTEEIVSALK